MRYSPTQYAKALSGLIEEAPTAKRREVIRAFLDTLARSGGLSLLPDIMREFKREANAKAKLHEVSVSAPERLSEPAVAQKLPFKARVHATKDIRLTGGTIIEVDGLRVDNSVNMRLGRIREALIK